MAKETVDARLGLCRMCQGSPADAWLNDDGPLCDLCFDARISASTGWPRLPGVPGLVEFVGPDGRHHLMRYRISRVPTGISLRLREDHVPPGEGYEFAVLGDHDADVAELIQAVLDEARAEIGRSYLEPGPTGGWQVVGQEVAGRVEFDEDTSSDGPPRLVVDGQPLTWEQLGETLSAFDGWRIRILLDDRCLDLRSADHDGRERPG